MITRTIICFITAILLAGPCLSMNQDEVNTISLHESVAMRMIGHRLLASSGDHTSRILPLEKNESGYKISFASEFQLNPDSLVQIVGQTMENAQIADHYFVEVKNCESGEVVYSYEIGGEENKGIVPCSGRPLPVACNTIHITLADAIPPTSSFAQEIQTALVEKKGTLDYLLSSLLFVLLLVMIGWYFFNRTDNTINLDDPNVFQIGSYLFNKKDMSLSINNKKTELTSKEADLLYLLYTSENKVLERQNILKSVWGNEGDYIGRTLDVFISKLRKKLSADNNLKIINIRGVGYKFVMG